MKPTPSRRTFVQQFSLALAGAPLLSAIKPPLIRQEMKSPAIIVKPSPEAAQDNTTADIIVDKLIAWQVKYIFGLTGDGINPLVEALRKKQDKIKYITVCHEESAAFMASGYAKYTGNLGVCIATTGPGAVHLMNGLYDAAMEGAPVLAIAGIVNHDLVGTQFTQEVDTIKMLQDIAVFNQTITGPVHAQAMVDLACRAATLTPGLSHITVSTDTQMKPLGEDKHSQKGAHLTGSSTVVSGLETPDDAALNQAADILNRYNKIVILSGRGALGSRKEVLELSDKLSAPIAKALLGKALIPDDSPYTTGGTGHLGTMPSKQMMEECEVLLILGSNMPHLDYYPKSAIGIQVDRDPKRIGLRYPVTLGLHGDVKSTLQSLLPKLKRKSDRSFLQLAQQRKSDWDTKMARIENVRSSPIKPFLVAQVSQLMNSDAVVAIDTGAHTVFTARHWKIKADQQLAVCGNLASMAPGLPYALAAQVAYPGRQCIAFVGDGSFTMLMGEMATAVLYQLPVKIIVFKNNALAMDRFEQEDLGNPDYGIALQPIDFAKIAEACGAEGYTCRKPDELEAVIRKAFASSKPALIEVEVDPDENPLPPEKIV